MTLESIASDLALGEPTRLPFETGRDIDGKHYVALAEVVVRLSRMTKPIRLALTLAQQEARAAALEEVASLKAEIRAAIQAQHYESEAHEATDDECAIDAMSMCQACGNEWPCDDAECWVTRLRALLEGK